ncbi:sensor histidine kinase [Desulfosporosinus lacus]|uniref:histidine kinase n=1 Tax=Desulfosporosinus lacus DSM 15449 TaxID=1121420 RepID=A0A1M5ZJ64_9FIRM|nr:sensor histidine kinase [Desulfosporosinus lacus]SHI24169.1 two-component system, NarL family, sensor histidine kinase ComP [Desulfosporosinus lacus DSM 15449]
MLDKTTFRRLALRTANVAFIIVCVVYVTILFNQPYVGLSLKSSGVNWNVTFSDPHGEGYRSGIRAGDRVIKINHDDPGKYPSTKKWGEAEGATTITVKSPEVPMRVVQIENPPFTYTMLSELPMATLGVVFWLVGLVTVFKRLFLAKAYDLFWLNWLAGLVIILAPVSSRGLILARELEAIGFSLVPVVLVKFISVFTNKVNRLNQLIIWVLGLISALLVTILVLNGLGVVIEVAEIRKLPLVNGLIGTVAVLGNLVWLIRLPADKPEKNQAAIVLAGLAMGLLPFVILTAVPILIDAPLIANPKVSALFIVIVPITLSYIVLNRSLPDGRMFLEFLIISLVSGILTCLLFTYFLFLIGVIKDLKLETYLLWLSLTGMALVIFNLFKVFVHYATDKSVFFHGRGGIETKIVALHGNPSSMNEALIVEELVSQLGLEGAFVIAEDQKGWHTKSAAGRYLGNPSEQAILEDYYRIAKNTGQAIECFSGNFPAELYIPFVSEEFTCGMFLGHRRSYIKFKANEVPLLTSMCYQLGQRLKVIHVMKQLSREINVMEKKSRETQRRSQGLEVINRLLFSNLEEEKKVLAREIHDGSLQIGLDLNRRMKELITNFPAGSNSFQTISVMQDMIEDLNYELRSICTNLRPSSLRDLGLIPAVEVMFEQIMQRELLVIVLDVIGMSREARFNEDIELVAFRFLQEGINNVIKHSGSSRVNVTITLVNRKIEMLMKDSGKGFDPQEIADWSLTGNHFGIIGMKERIESLGGDFSITSKIGQGVMLKASIPI